MFSCLIEAKILTSLMALSFSFDDNFDRRTYKSTIKLKHSSNLSGMVLIKKLGTYLFQCILFAVTFASDFVDLREGSRSYNAYKNKQSDEAV